MKRFYYKNDIPAFLKEAPEKILGELARHHHFELDILTYELDQNLTVTQSNKPRVISKREAIAKRIVMAAAAGDLKALRLIMKYMPPSSFIGQAKFVRVDNTGRE